MASKWSLREYFQIMRLTFKSLTHNSCNSSTYILDAAFEPVYWIIDNVAGFMGMVKISAFNSNKQYRKIIIKLLFLINIC